MILYNLIRILFWLEQDIVGMEQTNNVYEFNYPIIDLSRQF